MEIVIPLSQYKNPTSEADRINFVYLDATYYFIVSYRRSFNGLDVIFLANGTGRATNGDTRDWTCSGGMYKLTWHYVGNVDMLTVSGNSISGTRIFGIHVSATRK
jgi:hypothetical protein